MMLRWDKVWILLLTQIVFCAAQQCPPQPDVGGIVAGCILGTLAVCCLIGAIVFLFLWRRKQSRDGQPKPQNKDKDIEAPGAHAYDNPTFSSSDGNGNKNDKDKKTGGEGYVECREHDSPVKKEARFSFGGKPGTGQEGGRDNLEIPVRRTSHGSLTDVENESESETLTVALQSHDIIGLGFNICGSMRDGIYVSQVHHRGPAFESGKMQPGDRILSMTVTFANMVYEDALTILSYASPYPVMLKLERATAAEDGIESPRDDVPTTSHLKHPVYRSQSLGDLTTLVKQESLSYRIRRARSEMKRNRQNKKDKDKDSDDEEDSQGGTLRKWAGKQDVGEVVIAGDMEARNSGTLDIPDINIDASALLDEVDTKTKAHFEKKVDIEMDPIKMKDKDVEVELHSPDVSGSGTNKKDVSLLDIIGKRLKRKSESTDEAESDDLDLPPVPSDPPPPKRTKDHSASLNLSADFANKEFIDYHGLPDEDKLDVLRLSYEESDAANIKLKDIESDVSVKPPHVEISGKSSNINARAAHGNIGVDGGSSVEMGGVVAELCDNVGRPNFSSAPDHSLRFKRGSLERGDQELDVDLPSVGVNLGKLDKCVSDDRSGADVGIGRHGLDISVERPNVDINMGKPEGTISVERPGFGVNVGRPDVDINMDKPEGSISVEKSELDVGFRKPRFGVNVETPDVDINMEKLSGIVSVEKPELDIGFSKPGFGINVERPDVDISMDKPSGDINVEKPELDVGFRKPGLGVNVERPDVGNNMENPSGSFSGDKPELDVGLSKPRFGVNVERPDVDINIDKPSGSISVDKPQLDVGFRKPGLGINVERPDVDMDKTDGNISVEKPELDVGLGKPGLGVSVESPGASISTDKPESEISLRKANLDVGFENPEFDVNMEKPEVGFTVDRPKPEVSFGRPGIDVNVERPETDINMEKPDGSLSVESPKLDLGFEKPGFGVNVERPNINIDIDKPEGSINVKNPEFDVGLRKPGFGINVEKPDVDIRMDKPEGDISIGKPKLNVGFRKPGFGVNSEKPDVDISLDKPDGSISIERELDVGVSVAKPDIDISLDKPDTSISAEKPKLGFGFRKPGFDVNVERPNVDISMDKPEDEINVGIPKLDVGFEKPGFGVNLEKPDVDINVCKPDGTFSVEKPELDVGVRKPGFDVNVERHDVDINMDKPSGSVSVEKPEFDVGIRKPGFGINAERPDIDVSMDKASGSVSVEKPELDVGFRKPGVSFEGPNVDASMEKPEFGVSLEKPDVDFSSPGFKFDVGKPGVTLSTEKPEIDINVEKPDIHGVKPAFGVNVGKPNADVGIKEPDLKISAKQPEIDVDMPKAEIDNENDKSEITVSASVPGVSVTGESPDKEKSKKNGFMGFVSSLNPFRHKSGEKKSSEKKSGEKKSKKKKKKNSKVKVEEIDGKVDVSIPFVEVAVDRPSAEHDISLGVNETITAGAVSIESLDVDIPDTNNSGEVKTETVFLDLVSSLKKDNVEVPDHDLSFEKTGKGSVGAPGDISVDIPSADVKIKKPELTSEGKINVRETDIPDLPQVSTDFKEGASGSSGLSHPLRTGEFGKGRLSADEMHLDVEGDDSKHNFNLPSASVKVDRPSGNITVGEYDGSEGASSVSAQLHKGNLKFDAKQGAVHQLCESLGTPSFDLAVGSEGSVAGKARKDSSDDEDDYKVDISVPLGVRIGKPEGPSLGDIVARHGKTEGTIVKPRITGSHGDSYEKELSLSFGSPNIDTDGDSSVTARGESDVLIDNSQDRFGINLPSAKGSGRMGTIQVGSDVHKKVGEFDVEGKVERNVEVQGGAVTDLCIAVGKPDFDIDTNLETRDNSRLSVDSDHERFGISVPSANTNISLPEVSSRIGTVESGADLSASASDTEPVHVEGKLDRTSKSDLGTIGALGGALGKPDFTLDTDEGDVTKRKDRFNLSSDDFTSGGRGVNLPVVGLRVNTREGSEDVLQAEGDMAGSVSPEKPDTPSFSLSNIIRSGSESTQPQEIGSDEDSSSEDLNDAGNTRMNLGLSSVIGRSHHGPPSGPEGEPDVDLDEGNASMEVNVNESILVRPTPTATPAKDNTASSRYLRDDKVQAVIADYFGDSPELMKTFGVSSDTSGRESETDFTVSAEADTPRSLGYKMVCDDDEISDTSSEELSLLKAHLFQKMEQERGTAEHSHSNMKIYNRTVERRNNQGDSSTTTSISLSTDSSRSASPDQLDKSERDASGWKLMKDDSDDSKEHTSYSPEIERETSGGLSYSLTGETYDDLRVEEHEAVHKGGTGGIAYYVHIDEDSAKGPPEPLEVEGSIDDDRPALIRTRLSDLVGESRSRSEFSIPQSQHSSETSGSKIRHRDSISDSSSDDDDEKKGSGIRQWFSQFQSENGRADLSPVGSPTTKDVSVERSESVKEEKYEHIRVVEPVEGRQGAYTVTIPHESFKSSSLDDSEA